jgi:hypothetical protein
VRCGEQAARACVTCRTYGCPHAESSVDDLRALHFGYLGQIHQHLLLNPAVRGAWRAAGIAPNALTHALSLARSWRRHRRTSPSCLICAFVSTACGRRASSLVRNALRRAEPSWHAALADGPCDIPRSGTRSWPAAARHARRQHCRPAGRTAVRAGGAGRRGARGLTVPCVLRARVRV